MSRREGTNWESSWKSKSRFRILATSDGGIKRWTISGIGGKDQWTGGERVERKGIFERGVLCTLGTTSWRSDFRGEIFQSWRSLKDGKSRGYDFRGRHNIKRVDIRCIEILWISWLWIWKSLIQSKGKSASGLDQCANGERPSVDKEQARWFGWEPL